MNSSQLHHDFAQMRDFLGHHSIHDELHHTGVAESDVSKLRNSSVRLPLYSTWSVRQDWLQAITDVVDAQYRIVIHYILIIDQCQ